MAVAALRDAARRLAPLFRGAVRERLAVLYLDAGMRELGLDLFEGVAADALDLPGRAIFAAALRRDAAGLILAHNHPGGNPEPSRADIAATHRLAETARLLEIAVHDHLVFAGGRWRSLREMGLL